MAKGDLYKVLQDVHRTLQEKGGTDKLRESLNSVPHELRVSAAEIAKEINIQLQDVRMTGAAGSSEVVNTLGYNKGKGRTSRENALVELEKLGSGEGFTPTQQVNVQTLAEEYARNVLQFLNQRKGSNFEVDVIAGSDTEYIVRISKASDAVKLSVYDFLTKGDKAPLAMAKGTLRNKLVNAFNKMGNLRKNFDLHLGHITAVSEVQTFKSVGAVNVALDRAGTEVVKDLLKIELLSHFKDLGNPEFAKQFQMEAVYVRPESAASNITQSGYEKDALNKLRTAIKQVVEANKDWAEQGGSDSVVQAITKELINTAVKRGVKTNAKARKIDSASNTATLKIETKRRVVKAKAKVGSIDGLVKSKESPINLKALVPLINQKLPAVIRSYMGKEDRLVNRTGRFSESAYVLDVDPDLGITYSYMKYPYSVFESQGPRDPRPLIERSIREIATEIVRAKFNMRRV